MTTGKKSKPSYIYAIVGVSLVLFLIGILGWLMINGRALTRAFKEDIEVSIDFHDQTRDASVQALKTICDKQAWVREARIISKEEAIKMQSALENENIEAFLGSNPLFTSIALKVQEAYVNKDSLAKIKEFFMQSNVVRDVNYPTLVVNSMNANFRKISIILLVIAFVLFMVVAILIDNTVRLAMFSNRFLIKTMQMVGATRNFITRPFDQRALINGCISGVLATIGILLVKSFAEAQLPALKTLHNNNLFIILLIVMILMGMTITFLSTHRSVIKYLKTPIDDLY